MDAFRSPLRDDATADRVALISGGGTGIGRATALALAGSGARVAICGRRAERLEAVRAEIEDAGGECLAVAGDIREAGDVERIVGGALERYGAIDVLVNNAGGQFSSAAEEIVLRSRLALVEALTAYVVERHPYDVPHVTALPIVGGNVDYRAWICSST